MRTDTPTDYLKEWRSREKKLNTKAGVKHDEGKTKWSSAPWSAFNSIMEVMHFGAEKYGWDNWRLGLECDRLWSATLRHMVSWWKGEDFDPESGLSHLAHAACCMVFLLEGQIDGFSKDNRPNTPGQEEVDSGVRVSDSCREDGNCSFGRTCAFCCTRWIWDERRRVRPVLSGDDDQADGYKK